MRQPWGRESWTLRVGCAPFGVSVLSASSLSLDEELTWCLKAMSVPGRRPPPHGVLALAVWTQGEEGVEGIMAAPSGWRGDLG